MRTRNPAWLALAFLALVFTACGGGGGGGTGGSAATEPPPADDPAENPSVGQVLRDEVLSLSTGDFDSYTVEGSAYVFTSPSPELAGVGVGDILLYAEPTGFLRRVVGVSRPDESRVEILTTAAAMTDAFREAGSGTVRPVGDEVIDVSEGVSLKEPTEPDEGETLLRLDKQKTLDFPARAFDLRKDLYKSEKGEILLDGRISVEPSFYLDLYIDDYDGQTKLRSAELTGSLHAEGWLEAVAEVSDSFRTKPVQLFKRTQGFIAGPWLAGRVILEVDAFVDVDLSGHARAEADLDGDFSIGAKYDEDEGWSPIRTSEITFTTEIEAGVQGSVRPTVEFKFTVEFFGVADTGLVVAPYLDLSGSANSQNSMLEWNLAAGIEGGVFLGIGILDWNLAEWQSPRITFFSKELVSGEYRLGVKRPAAPTDLTTSADGSGIHLAWSDRSDDETAFEIEARVWGASVWRRIAFVARDTTGYTDSRTLSADSVHQYRVRATNDGGESAWTGISGCQPQSVDDYGDNRSSAKRIFTGNTLRGALEDYGDVDMFLLVPTWADKYRLRTLGDTDTEISLHDATGRRLAFDDDSGNGSNGQIETDLSSGKDYYIAVRGYRDETKGSYSIDVESIGGGSASSPGIGYSQPSTGTVSLELVGSSVSQTFIARVTDPDGDAKSVQWTLGGKNQGSPTPVTDGSKGTASKSMSFSSTGTYTVTARATDSGGKTSSTLTWTVTVRKPAPVKSSTTCSMTLGNSPSKTDEFCNVTVKVTRKGSASFAGGKVSFSVDGKVLGSKNPKNDIATFTVPPGPAGTRSLKAVFSGDSNYLDSQTTASLKVEKTTPTLIAGAVPNSFFADGPTTLVGKLTFKNYPVEGKALKLSVNGTQVESKATDGNGSVTKKYQPSSAGTYTLVVEFAGDAYMNGVKATKNFTANKRATYISVVLSRSSIALGEKATITGTMVANGKALPNKLLKVTANGSLLMTRNTDANGQVSYGFTPTSSGSQTIKVEFAGDGTYKGYASTVTLTVTKRKTAVTLNFSKSPAELKQYVTCSGKLTWQKSSGGQALGGKTVRIYIDGTYKGALTTKADGTYKFLFDPKTLGTRSFKMTYGGDSTYLSCQVTQSLIVKDTTSPGGVVHKSPSNGATTTNSSVTCSWSAATDADAKLRYVITLEKKTSIFSGYKPYMQGKTTNTVFAWTGLAKAKYRWRVYAVDSSGNTGPTSSWWTFEVK